LILGATARSCRDFVRDGATLSFTFIPAWVIGTEEGQSLGWHACKQQSAGIFARGPVYSSEAFVIA
jgi:hypothetical protein